MNSSVNKSHIQRVEDGKKRLEDLNNRRTRALTLLERDRADAEEARSEAIKLYGVSDIASLRILRETMTAENERMTVAFENSLASIEAKQSEVDKQLNG